MPFGIGDIEVTIAASVGPEVPAEEIVDNKTVRVDSEELPPWCGNASQVLVRSGANVTSENPERNDALQLEDGEQSDVREPERNGILRLDEMMSRRPRAIDTYRSLSYFNELIRLFVFIMFLSYLQSDVSLPRTQRKLN